MKTHQLTSLILNPKNGLQLACLSQITGSSRDLCFHGKKLFWAVNLLPSRAKAVEVGFCTKILEQPLGLFVSA